MNNYAPLSWRAASPRRTSFFPYNVESELGKIINDFFGNEPQSAGTTVKNWAPALDVHEAKDKYVVTAEVPGVSEKEIDISLADGVLRISGEKKEEFDRTEGKSHYVGRRFGSFTQQVYLDAPVDEDKIDASVKSGILTITLPKSTKEQEKVKKVSVRAEK